MSAPDSAGDVEGDLPNFHASATAQGKVNLFLGVGDRRDDGYHDVVTVFQAIDLTEKVTVTVIGDCQLPAHSVIGLSVTGRDADQVPTGTNGGDLANNLAVCGVHAVLGRYYRLAPGAMLPQMRLEIIKGVPVAGGMAGGSADAAAAMVATREILHGAGAAEHGYSLAPRPTDAEMRELARSIGADVPFCLLGGTALGTGIGDELLPVMSRGPRYWALALDPRGLSTPEVFAQLDRQREAAARGERPDVRAGDVTAVQRALLTNNSTELAALLSNDLQSPALSLRPELRTTLSIAREAGALGAVISGSGPTVAMLCSDRDHAVEIATAVSVAGHRGPTLVAESSPHGARPVA